MKILQISTQVFPVFPPAYGGLEMVVGDLAEELGKLGHDVFVLCPEGSRGEHFKVLTPCKPAFSNPEVVAYESIAPALGDFDVIHDHSWGGHVYIAKQQKPKLPVLHTLHAPTPYAANPVPKPCWVSASRFHADFTFRLLGSQPRVCYHGIDLKRHSFDPTIGKEDFLLYLARVQPIKGALEFMNLCLKTGMKGKLAGEDWYIPGEDQDYARRIMQACAATNGQVEYLGRVAQEYKVELLRKARCLVCPLNPPYYEIFGLTTIEAAACGTPVLSTDRGAARELIQEGETGAVVDNDAGLEAGLKVALACRPEDCVTWAQGFGRDEMALEYLELYQDVANGREW